MCACFGHFTEPVQPLPVLESAYVNEEYTAILVTREHVISKHKSTYLPLQKPERNWDESFFFFGNNFWDC